MYRDSQWRLMYEMNTADVQGFPMETDVQNERGQCTGIPNGDWCTKWTGPMHRDLKNMMRIKKFSTECFEIFTIHFGSVLISWDYIHRFKPERPFFARIILWTQLSVLGISVLSDTMLSAIYLDLWELVKITPICQWDLTPLHGLSMPTILCFIWQIIAFVQCGIAGCLSLALHGQ